MNYSCGLAVNYLLLSTLKRTLTGRTEHPVWHFTNRYSLLWANICKYHEMCVIINTKSAAVCDFIRADWLSYPHWRQQQRAGEVRDDPAVQTPLSARRSPTHPHTAKTHTAAPAMPWFSRQNKPPLYQKKKGVTSWRLNRVREFYTRRNKNVSLLH